MEKFEAKMKSAGLNQAAIDAFRVNYEQLIGGATGMVRSDALTFIASTGPDCRSYKLGQQAYCTLIEDGVLLNQRSYVARTIFSPWILMCCGMLPCAAA